jgi:succinate dehydrogenase / fumarate reductase cytochrome b subunit
MAQNKTFYSIIKKVIMSITGLFLISFLVVHLSGNLLLFKDDGGEAFNAYAKFMSTNPLIGAMEYVLAAGFLFHIVDGIILTIQNRRARPTRYAVTASSPGTSWTSRNMGITGSVILIFLVIHLKSFFVEHRLLGNDTPMYDLVAQAFQSPLYSGFYVVSMVLLGLHLAHGFSSAFQSLGLRHKSYFWLIRAIGVIFSIVVPAGFASMPIYFFFK